MTTCAFGAVIGNRIPSDNNLPLGYYDVSIKCFKAKLLTVFKLPHLPEIKK
jgi:hypothetical protein